MSEAVLLIASALSPASTGAYQVLGESYVDMSDNSLHCSKCRNPVM